MNVNNYIGMPYSLRPMDGCVNCWGLVGIVYANEMDETIKTFSSITLRGISDAFTAAFASGEHGFNVVDSCADYDVAVFISDKGEYHCGVMYNDKVLHATNKKGQVVYESLSVASEEFDRVEFWRL